SKCLSQHLEVSRVHSQSEGVQLTEVQQTCSQIVDFGHSFSNSSKDGLSVLLHLGRAGAQVLPVGEIGLGLWVHHQHPSACSHVYLARASAPMSSAFPDTLAQKALTVFLSLALRLVILSLSDCLSDGVISSTLGGFMLTESWGTPGTTSKIGCMRRSK
uniref:Uncharacterized protein n=1 Tax=Anabas testudineus TaxID=64144 RepID=A0A7N5ZUD8_ANATE